MKRTYYDAGQEIWIYQKRLFSIVDMRVVPKLGSKNIPTKLNEAFEEVMDTLFNKPYAVAEITSKVTPLQSFRSGEEAIEFVKQYVNKKVYNLDKDA